MEKIKSICVMRELLKAMNDIEAQLQQRFGVSVNEAMVLCCIGHDTITASGVSETIGLTPSNTSKILRSVESKGLVARSLGETDRRQMRFALTGEGKARLGEIRDNEIDVPEFISPLFV